MTMEVTPSPIVRAIPTRATEHGKGGELGSFHLVAVLGLVLLTCGQVSLADGSADAARD